MRQQRSQPRSHNMLPVDPMWKETNHVLCVHWPYRHTGIDGLQQDHHAGYHVVQANDSLVQADKLRANPQLLVIRVNHRVVLFIVCER